MELLAFLLAVIIKVLPAKIAMPVISGGFLVLAILAFVWHSHLAATVNLCNTGRGEFAQLFNSSARASCGLDTLLSPVTMIAGVVLVLIALIPGAVWAYQLTHPDWDLKAFADDALI